MILMCLFLFLFVCFIRLFIDLAFYETALLWQIFLWGDPRNCVTYFPFYETWYSISVSIQNCIIYSSKFSTKTDFGNEPFVSIVNSAIVASPGAPDLCTKSMYY